MSAAAQSQGLHFIDAPVSGGNLGAINGTLTVMCGGGAGAFDTIHPVAMAFAKAVALAEPGIEKSELIRECVKAFIQRQSARRLAALGGQAPDVELAPRRREDAPAS